MAVMNRMSTKSVPGEAAVRDETIDGEPAVFLRAGDYLAAALPGVGGNLFRLVDERRQLTILHEPPNVRELREHPVIYGIPALFPPNRIRDGVFTANGIRYELPVNTRDNNHCHGMLARRPWQVTRLCASHAPAAQVRAAGGSVTAGTAPSVCLEAAGASRTGTGPVPGSAAAGSVATEPVAELEMSFTAEKGSEHYGLFPHRFVYRNRYILSRFGLRQEIAIENLDDRPLPLGVGFHTAFHIPFVNGSSPENCRLRVSVGTRWEFDGRILPTGNTIPDHEGKRRYLGDGIHPTEPGFEEHWSTEPMEHRGGAFRGAVITDRVHGYAIEYELGPSFIYTMIWNSRGGKGVVCAEPMTWMIDAPNMKLPPSVTGFRMLDRGETFRDRTEIRVVEATG